MAVFSRRLSARGALGGQSGRPSLRIISEGYMYGSRMNEFPLRTCGGLQASGRVQLRWRSNPLPIKGESISFLLIVGAGLFAGVMGCAPPLKNAREADCDRRPKTRC